MAQASELYGATLSTIEVGLVAGTTSTYTTDASTAGCINGKFVTPLTAQTNTATPTTDTKGNAFTALAVSEVSVFVFSTTVGGVIGVDQGSIESLDGAGAVGTAPQFPDVDLETYMPFGYVVVVNSSAGSAWTFGTTSFGATGITDTYTQIMTLPKRPVIA